MWDVVARVPGLGLPSALAATDAGGVRVRVLAGVAWLDRDGAVVRRLRLVPDAPTVARVVSGPWTWLPTAFGARILAIADGALLGGGPRPSLLGFAGTATHAALLADGRTVVHRADGLVIHSEGGWSQLAAGARLWAAGRDGLAVWDGGWRRCLETPVRGVRVIGDAVWATGELTHVLNGGDVVDVVPVQLAPGLPAVAHDGAVWVAPAVGRGLLELAGGRPRRHLLDGRTVLSLAAGPRGLLAVVASGMGQARLVEVRGSVVHPGPEVDRYAARVVWSADRLVCGGLRELAIFRRKGD